LSVIAVENVVAVRVIPEAEEEEYDHDSADRERADRDRLEQDRHS
jgi:hypothetical protein